MRGLLADVNVQGHLSSLRRLLVTAGRWPVIAELNVAFATFTDVQLPRDLDDRTLWDFCQQEGWILFTENRNDDGPDSLQATLNDSWRNGHLPVLTLANKRGFERDQEYARRVATDVAELVYGIAHSEYLDLPRIYIPLVGH